MFPDKHHHSLSGVSQRIGNGLKSGLPTSCPNEAKESLSVKSLRQGSITETSLHPRAGLFEVCGMSGHKTGCNIDSYLDPNKIERSFPAAKILAEHNSVHKNVEFTKPWWLPSPKCRTPFEKMHEILLTGNVVPAFHKGGHMHFPSAIALAQHIM